jgi:putative transposase
MRKSRFTDAQIIGMIKEQEAGLPIAELCRKHGLSPATFYLSPATFYKLKAKYGGMDVSDAKRLRLRGQRQSARNYAAGTAQLDDLP